MRRRRIPICLHRTQILRNHHLIRPRPIHRQAHRIRKTPVSAAHSAASFSACVSVTRVAESCDCVSDTSSGQARDDSETDPRHPSSAPRPLPANFSAPPPAPPTAESGNTPAPRSEAPSPAHPKVIAALERSSAPALFKFPNELGVRLIAPTTALHLMPHVPIVIQPPFLADDCASAGVSGPGVLLAMTGCSSI